jgi:hypothetical protein
MMTVRRRVPFEPLWRWCMLRHEEPPWDNHSGFTADMCGVMIGRSADWVRTHRHRGLSAAQADEIATHLGWNPRVIWGDAWNTAMLFDELARVS